MPGQRSIEGHSPRDPAGGGSWGVRICLENVWNQFLYEHNRARQSEARPVHQVRPMRFAARWVRPSTSTWSNHRKYGNPAEWLRAMGHAPSSSCDTKDFKLSDEFVLATSGERRRAVAPKCGQACADIKLLRAGSPPKVRRRRPQTAGQGAGRI